MFLRKPATVRAPEFPQGLDWIGKKASMKTLRGKVVLIDFWTYSCVNCIRTMPHLVEWHERYKDEGLVILGIHTPEFAFEREEALVTAAMKRFGITYPVALDNDFLVWKSYANRWWPRKFLVNHKGEIVYDHIGEGGYVETEAAIQAALHEIGAKHLPAIVADDSIGGGVCYRTTPELYLGFLRGTFGNHQKIIPNDEEVYDDKGNHDEDHVYLHGHWMVAGESLRHERALPILNEYLLLRYSAFSVNLVMGGTNGKKIKVELELDGQPVPEDMAGADVKIEEGRSFVEIKDPRMYRLIDADTYHRGTLKIKTSSPYFEAFAFTFGGCKGV
ncbi:MAG: redoxin family protein [bacterium]|nr:redoxin family protein [bacterium]